MFRDHHLQMRYGVLIGVLGTFVVANPDSTFGWGGTRKPVTYSSQCSCEDDHGVARWRAKTDSSEPPHNAADIHAITPSEIAAWQGPYMIPRGGARIGNELRWYALTGRVITVQAEDDGDIHMVLVDAEGKGTGKVIAEIPLGQKWCAMRTTAFSWTDASFPFQTAGPDSYPFRLVHHPVVTVIGRAFYDTDHSGKNYKVNRRPRDKEKSVWEIHPVMALRVHEKSEAPRPAPRETQATPAPPPPPSAPATPAPKLTTAEAVEEARGLYPDLLNANSRLYREDWARYQRYKQTNPHFFDDPEWPLNLADECAEALGIKAEE